MTAHDVQATAHTITARRSRRCDDYPCHVEIQPGEDYVRSVTFPRHEANGGTTPWVLNICKDSYTQYGRAMPPRRTKKSAPPAPTERTNPDA